jgi:hypothetical protein
MRAWVTARAIERYQSPPQPPPPPPRALQPRAHESEQSKRASTAARVKGERTSK